MTHPIAQIDPARCTGCGRCISACDLRLIAFETRDWKKRSVVQDPGHCTGCGDCASRCPVNAISLAEDHQGKASPL
jgi:ferredoxin